MAHGLWPMAPNSKKVLRGTFPVDHIWGIIAHGSDVLCLLFARMNCEEWRNIMK
jgi:hypothetical protein